MEKRIHMIIIFLNFLGEHEEIFETIVMQQFVDFISLIRITGEATATAIEQTLESQDKT